jgi:hypothetical protein
LSAATAALGKKAALGDSIRQRAAFGKERHRASKLQGHRQTGNVILCECDNSQRMTFHGSEHGPGPIRSSMAFSSEVETGSREENASKQELRASVLIRSEPERF